MKLHCATIRNDVQTFTVVIAPKHVIDDQHQAAQTIAFLEDRCFQMPTVLVACNESRVPTAFYGRSDLAVLLAPLPPAAIQWQERALQGVARSADHARA